MNSEKVNTWLSLAAIFGVIVGLMLLMVEIRQNTEMMRAQIRGFDQITHCSFREVEWPLYPRKRTFA